MARAKKKVEPAKVDIGMEVFAALRDLEKVKGIPVEYMVERMKQGMANAYRKDREDRRDVPADNVVVDLSEKGLFVHVTKTVVEELEDTALEIHIDAAKNYNPDAKLGDIISIPVDVDKFSRIAAQTFKQVLIQGIREAERGMVYESYADKAQELLTATVLRIDPNGNVFVRIGQGNEASDAVMRTSEQIPGETYSEGQLIRVYVLEVRQSQRGPLVHVSRTIPTWCAVCSSWKPPKSLRARWRSATSPVRQAAVPRWRSVPPRRSWIPWAPALAPVAAVLALWWKSWVARRSTSWCGAKIPVNM